MMCIHFDKMSAQVSWPNEIFEQMPNQIEIWWWMHCSKPFEHHATHLRSWCRAKRWMENWTQHTWFQSNARLSDSHTGCTAKNDRRCQKSTPQIWWQDHQQIDRQLVECLLWWAQILTICPIVMWCMHSGLGGRISLVQGKFVGSSHTPKFLNGHTSVCPVWCPTLVQTSWNFD